MTAPTTTMLLEGSYKGKAVSVPQVGRELGVRFVMEGSIQTNGDRVRVTAQLIEAAGNIHVWSNQFDRALDDVFGFAGVRGLGAEL